MPAGPIIYGSQGNVNYPVAVRPQAQPNMMLAGMMAQPRENNDQQTLALMMALLQMAQAQDSRGEGARQFDESQRLTRELAAQSGAREDARFQSNLDLQQMIQHSSESNQNAINSLNEKLANLQVNRAQQESDMINKADRRGDLSEARSNVEAIIGPMDMQAANTAKARVEDAQAARAIQQQTTQFRAPDVSAPGLQKLDRAISSIGDLFNLTQGWSDTTKAMTDYSAAVRQYVFDPHITDAERSMRAEAVMPDVERMAGAMHDLPVRDTIAGYGKRMLGGKSDRQQTQQLLSDTADSFRREIRHAIKPGQETQAQMAERSQMRDEISKLAQKRAVSAQVFREGRWQNASPTALESAAVNSYISGKPIPATQPATQPTTNPSPTTGMSELDKYYYYFSQTGG